VGNTALDEAVGISKGELSYLRTEVREHLNLRKYSSSQDH
jgi:hypothetical protein